MAKTDFLQPVTAEVYRDYLVEKIAFKPKELKIQVADDCLPMLEKFDLEWVVMELVGNCSEKGPETVTVDMVLKSVPSGKVRMEVGDDVVYEPEQLEKILANITTGRAVRMNKGVLRAKENADFTGIGISSCKKIVEFWGGNMWHESTATGGIRVIAEWDREQFFKTRKAPSQFIEWLAER